MRPARTSTKLNNNFIILSKHIVGLNFQYVLQIGCCWQYCIDDLQAEI